MRVFLRIEGARIVYMTERGNEYSFICAGYDVFRSQDEKYQKIKDMEEAVRRADEALARDGSETMVNVAAVARAMLERAKNGVLVLPKKDEK